MTRRAPRPSLWTVRLGAAACWIVLAALTGCGSNGGGTTATSSTTEWANSLCGAVATWESALKSVADGLKSGQNITKTGLEDYAQDVEGATKTLTDDLRGLGTPPAPKAQEAKATVDQLGTELSSSADKIKSTVEGLSGAAGILSAVSVVSATLVTMGNDVSSTVAELKALDPQGSFKQAFAQADACASLKNQ